MRKFIATGLGAITAATTLAIGVPAAHASPAIPGICTALPTTVATIGGLLGTANATQTIAQTDYNTKNAAMITALHDYAVAAANYLIAVDSGGNVALTKSILDSRVADAGVKVSDWSAARVALFNANGSVLSLQANSGLVSDFQAALCP